MKQSDKERLKKVVQYWRELSDFLKRHNVTENTLLINKDIQWAVNTPLYNIGEQVYRLTPDLKNAHPELPWSSVSGLRHRLVHEYEEINWNKISEIIFEEMDDFVKSVEEIIKKM